ncbi:MAG TPA: class IV adenylate cyclase [Pyrinomonadaceae bacterium]|jgi:adenylate cyclase class 2
MATEIEKKYRLTLEQRDALSRRLRQVGATLHCREFEENTMYAGVGLDPRRQVLRLRRVGGAAVFTYKERHESASAIKRHREDETRVEDATALASILEALGYRPTLVYEKRRSTWHIRQTEVVLDELPFGLFVEIEGEENDITEIENLLDLSSAEAEMSTYPELAAHYGERRGGIIEARFQMTLPEV